MTDSRPTLTRVLDAAIAQGLAGLRVMVPGEVIDFDAPTQTATIQPLLSDLIFDGGGTVGTVVQLPPINSVPVQFPGAGGFAETWPVAAGDPCLLVFADRSLDNWYERGGVVDPVEERRHDITDAVAILGVRSKPGKLTDFDATRAVWGNKGPRIAADGTILHLGVAHGESAAQAVLRGNLMLDQLGLMLDVIDTASTTAGNTLSGAGIALSAAAPLNAVTFIGGSLAAGPIGGAGVAINSAGAALLTIKAAVAAFKAQFAAILSTKAKVS